jgi:3-isopropylmalate dehydrogenase
MTLSQNMASEHKIVLMPGDGIGPDVLHQGVRVLEKVSAKYGYSFVYEECLIGGIAYDSVGTPLPDKTVESCVNADAVLLGAVGGPQWDHIEVKHRPEQGLLGIRKALGLYANIRPVIVYPELADASPIKNEIVSNTDLVVVRELLGGIYFGKRDTIDDYAYDTCEYKKDEIERIIRFAANLANNRRKKLTSVDKHNVLDTSRLWRNTCEQLIRQEFPDLDLEHMYIDAATMHLITKPSYFDVLVMDNMFGDILSDETSVLSGSMGLLPSASLNESKNGIYEPIHGSAPDIVGKDIANPIASILSVAMMLDYSFEYIDAAEDIRNAVAQAITQGHRTVDIARSSDQKPLKSSQFTDQVLLNI